MSALCLRVGLTCGALTLRVDLEVGSRPVALVGPNGSGKTTLLRVVAGARRPSEGFVRLGGRTLFDASDGVDVGPEHRGVGYVPQGYGLFPHLRVEENVAFGLANATRRLPRAARLRAARAQLETLDCASLARRFPANLSGGEQQRVAMARALVTDPDLLLLDEPFAAMDVTARRRLRARLAAQLKQRALPCLLATHDLRDALALDALVCVLDGGRVVQRGDLDELRRAPVNDFVAEWVEGLPDSHG